MLVACFGVGSTNCLETTARRKDVSTHLVNGPGDSLTAFSDIRNCLWNVPKIDSRLRLLISGSGVCATSFGCKLSSILTIIEPGDAEPSSNLVHDKSPLGDSGSNNDDDIFLVYSLENKNKVFFYYANICQAFCIKRV